jgi:uncharacterized membrane protein (DUF485 family)
MFSSRLEQRRRVRRFALIVAVTVFVTGIGLIAVVARQGLDFLGAAEADRMPLGIAVLWALAGLVVLTVAAYVAVRVFSKVE